jgi:hypothetical protein
MAVENLTDAEWQAVLAALELAHASWTAGEANQEVSVVAADRERTRLRSAQRKIQQLAPD